MTRQYVIFERRIRLANQRGTFDSPLHRVPKPHWPANGSECKEHFIINSLRAAHALTVSLVAETDGQVVGHIAFSPVTISDGATGWYGLGPVSVLPEYQQQGIGTSLINTGLSRLKALGGRGCALVGAPNYYQRFGFRNIPDVPRGTVVFHEGFLANS